MSAKKTVHAGTGVLTTRLLPELDDKGRHQYEYRIADARVGLDHRGMAALPVDAEPTSDVAMSELLGNLFLAEGARLDRVLAQACGMPWEPDPDESLFPEAVNAWTAENAVALEAVEERVVGLDL